MRKIIVLFILAFDSLLADAQNDSLATKNLYEVIVTGQYKPQSLKNSVYQVRVINQERIRLSGATSIQQVMNNQLGFRLLNDNALGTTDVELLGMSGRNVKILLDGVPMMDKGDTRESLGQIDINTIERIEIVEGPMSVSYGSDALAGVINIITKRPEKDQLSLTLKAQEETAGSEYYPGSFQGVHTQSLYLNWQKKNWSFSAGGNHNDMNGFGGDTYGRDKTWRPKEQWLAHARIGYTTKKIAVYYRLDGLDEEISSRKGINLNTYKAIDQNYISRRFTHQLQNAWKLSDKINLSSILAYTDYERRTKTIRRDFTNGSSELTTGPGDQDLAKFTSFVFRNTFSWIVSPKLSFQPGIDINHEKANGDRIKGTPVINDYAFFISSEIKASRKINIRPGLRFVKNSVYDAPPVIPSINTKFELNKNLDLRLAYAYGFRSPALRELYFNFIDANHIIIGNPDLKAENSNSFSGSLTGTWPKIKGMILTSSLAGFYNQFNNLINYANSPTSNDTTITVNIDQFKTVGATLENKLTWKELNASLGFSYIGRYNVLSEDEIYKSEDLPSFNWAPEINSNITYNVKKIKTSFGLFYKYTGERPGYQVATNTVTQLDEISLTKIAAFHWADLTITKSFFKNITASGGVKNIFDVTNLVSTASSGGTHSTSGAVAMSYGRSYFLGLSYRWVKK